jgi:capsule polysaccharide export protein KpsE/RkpR
MLFARAISNGVKWFTPDIYDAPVYVPEEMQDIQTIETEAIVITDPLEGVKAIATINACNDIEVLEATYKSLPAAIQRDKAVIAAAKERKALLTDKTTSNE